MQSMLYQKWKLKACRIQAGLTQKEVASAIGVSEISVVNWEQGKTAPSMSNAQKLSELYQIPIMNMDFRIEANTK